MTIALENEVRDQSENRKGIVLHVSKQNQSVTFRAEIGSLEGEKPTSTLTVRNATASVNEVIDSLFSIESPQSNTTSS